MRKRINVTKTDIKRGKRASECECPVARAMLRHFGVVSVGFTSVYFGSREKSVRLSLPDGIMNFIRRFDDGVRSYQLKPFSFIIDTERELIEEVE